jgi:hypothetical protein
MASFVFAHPAKNGHMFSLMKFWDGCCRFGSQLFLFFLFLPIQSATCQPSFPEVPFQSYFFTAPTDLYSMPSNENSGNQKVLVDKN